MLEVEPGSVDIHNDSPPRVTKEQPANLQTKGDNDKTQGQERHQGMAVLGIMHSSDTCLLAYFCTSEVLSSTVNAVNNMLYSSAL